MNCFLLWRNGITVFSDVLSRMSKGWFVDWRIQRKYVASGRKQDRDYRIEMAKYGSLVVFCCDGGGTM